MPPHREAVSKRSPSTNDRGATSWDATRSTTLTAGIVVAFLTVSFSSARGASPDPLVLDAETRRIEMIERISPSVVCVYDSNLRGGGSGVLIDAEGYGLTNYHVVRGMFATRSGWGGLGDGVLYELEVLGVDITGDVAMFRLIPPKDGYKFPFVKLGDSDVVEVGDTAIAIGNPFVLSEDYSPTVTLGIVTGVHRYQWGVRGNLVYSDCIQVDTPINPGNSGGPLFNAAGEVIGINGRISVNTRGRLNVGFGYAISANQIARFIPTLRAGLLARHGTWQARVEFAEGAGLVFSEVKEPGPAHDAGVRHGDKLVTIDGTTITTANQVASILGTYPADWPVALTIETKGRRRRVVVRLEAIEPRTKKPFEVRPEINERQTRRIVRNFRRLVLGDRAAQVPARWSWRITRVHQRGPDDRANPPEHFELLFEGDGPIRMQRRYQDGAAGRIIQFDENAATQRVGEDGEAYDLPSAERMMLAALYKLHTWVRQPADTLDLTNVSHVGGYARITNESGDDGPADAPSETQQIEAELLEVIEWTIGDQGTARFAFDPSTSAAVRLTVLDRLAGAETTIELSDYQDVGGIVWPGAMEVRGHGLAYRDKLPDWSLSP